METMRHASPTHPQIFSTLMGRGSQKEVAHSKTHCWYCNAPLNGYRRFCSKACEEAIYEDNEAARKRRMIFGCQC